MADAETTRLRRGVRVPLRDGVNLHATIYLPRDELLPAPTLLALTPYIADYHYDRGVYFAAQGFVFVAVDVRGRGNSEGVFRPNIQEAEDGHDTIEWLAGQSFSNGRIAMWGGSYLGYCQWVAAKELPPHLTTIVPTAAPFFGIDFPMRSNIFLPFVVRWLTLTAGKAAQIRAFSDGAFWRRLYKLWYESGLPFRELDAVLGGRLSHFQEWLRHPQPDDYWDAYNPTPDQYANIAVPILTITGCYDDDQPGALAHYCAHLANAPREAGLRHFLVIGPWDHAGTTTPRKEIGGLKLGDASLLDIARLHVEWYSWTMRGGPKPEFLVQQVMYYVIGAERWRSAATLDAVTSRHQPLYLHSRGTATEVFADGYLGAVCENGPPDTYRFDPRQWSHVIGSEITEPAHWLIDQRALFAMHGCELVYHSAPFPEDIEVSGFFRLTAWIAIDRPDTDLYASVYEIGLDGSSIRLTTDAIRARYRQGRRVSELIRTQEPLQYRFESFTFISRQIRKGHRLRLIIAPLGSLSDSMLAEINRNGGGIVAEESAEDAHPVTVSLFHDPVHQSILFVPIAQPCSSGD